MEFIINGHVVELPIITMPESWKLSQAGTSTLSSNSGTQMYRTEDDKIVYVKPLGRVGSGEPALEVIASLFNRAFLPEQTANEGLIVCTDEEGGKKLMFFSESLAQGNGDRWEFEGGVVSRMPTLLEFREKYPTTMVEGLEKIVVAEIIFRQQISHSNNALVGTKTDEDGNPYYYAYKIDAEHSWMESLSQILTLTRGSVARIHSRLLQDPKITIVDADDEDDRVYSIDMFKVSSALERGVEFLEALNADNRAVINEIIQAVHDTLLNYGIFETEMQKDQAIRAFKIFHPIADKTISENAKLFLEFINIAKLIDIPEALKELLQEKEIYTSEWIKDPVYHKELNSPLYMVLEYGGSTLEGKPVLEWFCNHNYNVVELLRKYEEVREEFFRLNTHGDSETIDKKKEMFADIDQALLREAAYLKENLPEIHDRLYDTYEYLIKDIGYGNTANLTKLEEEIGVCGAIVAGEWCNKGTEPLNNDTEPLVDPIQSEAA